MRNPERVGVVGSGQNPMGTAWRCLGASGEESSVTGGALWKQESCRRFFHLGHVHGRRWVLGQDLPAIGFRAVRGHLREPVIMAVFWCVAPCRCFAFPFSKSTARFGGFRWMGLPYIGGGWGMFPSSTCTIGVLFTVGGTAVYREGLELFPHSQENCMVGVSFTVGGGLCVEGGVGRRFPFPPLPRSWGFVHRGWDSRI